MKKALVLETRTVQPSSELLDMFGAANCAGVRHLQLGSVTFHYHRRTMEGLAEQIRAYMRGHAAALLVQHERTGIKANLRLALARKPLWYVWRIANRLLGRRSLEDRFLCREVAGHLSGLLFYLRNRREEPA